MIGSRIEIWTQESGRILIHVSKICSICCSGMKTRNLCGVAVDYDTEAEKTTTKRLFGKIVNADWHTHCLRIRCLKSDK